MVVATFLFTSGRNADPVAAALLRTGKEQCLSYLDLSFERCSSTGRSGPVESDWDELFTEDSTCVIMQDKT